MKRLVIRLNKVISELTVNKYKVLILDERQTNIDYNSYLIDGKEYKPVSIYDAPNCIAIESDDTFKGKTVEFV